MSARVLPMGALCAALWSCQAGAPGPHARNLIRPQRTDAPWTADEFGAADHAEPEDMPQGEPAAPIAAEQRDDSERPAAAQRIGALGAHVWIMPRPSRKGLALGKLRLGTSVALRAARSMGDEGCARGWRSVEPRGYICLDRHTTLDLSAAHFRALAELTPQPDAVFPYRYAYSRGAPMYLRVPAAAEWREAERDLGPPGSHLQLGEWARAQQALIERHAAIAANDPVPWFFAGGHRRFEDGAPRPHKLVYKHIPNGSLLAYARAFEMHGRTWLVTPDLMLVPADRVQPMRRSSFQGVALDDETRLPIAFNRSRREVPLWRKDAAGRWSKTGASVAARGWVMVSGERAGSSEEPYWALRGRPGIYVKGEAMTVSRPRRKLPRAIKPGEKWIDAHITPGTLTAYEGLRPVFATLFSPGKGGHPTRGRDHRKYATTSTGYFRFEWKERAATMSNEKGEPKVFWLSEVPHLQYIRAPLGMQVAYWHEDFGRQKSAGGVNVSPRDGKWLFDFTDPPLPADWGAVRPGGGFGRSTPIIINGY